MPWPAPRGSGCNEVYLETLRGLRGKFERRRPVQRVQRDHVAVEPCLLAGGPLRAPALPDVGARPWGIGLTSDGTVAAVGWNEHSQCNVSGWRGIQLPGN